MIPYIQYNKNNTIQNRSEIYYNSASKFARDNLLHVEMYGHYVCDSNYRVVRDPFDSYLLILTLSGNGILVTSPNGESSCCKNDIALINCNNYHTYYADRHWEFLWFHFNGAHAGNLCDHLIADFGNVSPLDSASPVFQSFRAVTEKPQLDTLNHEILIAAEISRILSGIITSHEKAHRSSRDFALITRAIDYIDKEYMNDLSVRKIAAELSVSESNLSHVFKHETGVSPYEFLLNKRINQAKYLLKLSNKTVSQIALEIGFQSDSHFVKTFRERTHTTPSAFRKNASFEM